MGRDFEREKEIFAVAAELTGDARGAYLDEACRGDDQIRSLIESLLRNDDLAQEFDLMETAEHQFTISDASDRLLNRRIGPYLVSKRIGKGGMGQVYAATRVEGYKEEVAIKFLRQGTR